jgi:hypothetical protein
LPVCISSPATTNGYRPYVAISDGDKKLSYPTATATAAAPSQLSDRAATAAASNEENSHNVRCELLNSIQSCRGYCVSACPSKECS